MKHEDTIREAHALLAAGHIAAAIACLAEYVNSLPAPVVASPCTDEDNPEWMCKACKCWKAFRAACS